MTNRKRWKTSERAIAAKLGGVRVPVTGRSRGSAPDIAHDLFSIEVKTREKLPKWLNNALDQAKASRTHVGHVPLVVLHEVGDRHDDDLAIVRLADLVTLTQPV